MIMNEPYSGDEMHKSISAVRHLEPWGKYPFPTFSIIYIGGGFESNQARKVQDARFEKMIRQVNEFTSQQNHSFLFVYNYYNYSLHCRLSCSVGRFFKPKKVQK